jgi:hypothetical protein
MKKYLVFMFCLVFVVSFISCGTSRQPQNGDPSKQKKSGDTDTEGSPESHSAPTLPPPDVTDNFILQAGDQVILASYTKIGDKYKLVFKFTRKPAISMEMSIEVAVAKNEYLDSLKGVLQKVINIGDEREMYVAVYSFGTSDRLVFFSFANTDKEKKCSFSSDCRMYRVVGKSDLSLLIDEPLTLKEDLKKLEQLGS